MDWTAPFTEAAVDLSRFHTVAPVWTAPVDVDEKKAWDGTFAEQPGVPLHVEAGAYRGRLVWFRIFGPWNVAVPLRAAAPPALVRFGADVGSAIAGLVLIPAVVLAVRNVRRGRGDRRSALRFALVMTVTSGLALLFRADHPGGPREMDLIDTILSRCVWNGAVLWLFYMALEPYVRRNLPQTLIG